MEKYKKALKQRIYLLAIPTLFGAAIGIYDVFYASELLKNSSVFGFQCGMATALGILSAVLIVKYNAILKDETKLKLQYNKENDERSKAIRAKAGMPMLLITSLAMIGAAIISAYFSETVFIILVITALAQLSVGCIAKFIYMKNM